MHLQETKVIVTNIVVTFVQGGVAGWIALGGKLDKAGITAFLTAGLSAAWNLALKPKLKEWGWLGKDA